MKVLFIAAIGMVIYGSFSFARSGYISMTWNETQGEVIDFE